MRKASIFLVVLIAIILSTSVVYAAKINTDTKIMPQETENISSEEMPEPELLSNTEEVSILPIDPEPQPLSKDDIKILPVEPSNKSVQRDAIIINNTLEQQVKIKDIKHDIQPLASAYPQWSNELAIPSSPTYYEDGKVYQFSIDWTDDVGIEDVYLTFDGQLYNYSTSNISKTGNTYYKILTNLSINTHNYGWGARDADMNWNWTNSIQYVIKDPTPQLTINGIQGNLTINYGTVSTTLGTAEIGSVYLYRNGALVSNPEIIILGAGIYNYTVYNDFTKKSKTYFLTVNKATPNINLMLNNEGHFDNFPTYTYRYKIYKDTINEEVVSVNDTYGIRNNIIWAKILNESYVYSSLSGPSGSMVIGNDTDEKYWENETTRTGNNPTLVWGNNTVGVWHFGENSGNAIDSTQYKNNAINTNAIYGATCKFGKCFEYSGTKQVIIPDSASLSFTGSFTIRAIVYNHVTGTRETIVAKDNSYATRSFYLERTDSNQYRCVVINNAGGYTDFVTTINFPANNWFDVVCMFNATNSSVAIWVNGVEQPGVRYGSVNNVQDSIESLRIGATNYNNDGGSRFFDGLIDEVRIYNETKTPSEIQSMYRNGINNYTRLGVEEQGSASGVITYPTPANATATLNISGNFYLYRNGTEVASGTNLINEFMVLPAGSYNYTVYYPGNENYTEVFATNDLTVERGIADLAFNITPSSPITYGAATIATCAIGNSEQSMILYRNATDVTADENGQPMILPAGVYNYNCSVAQTENYTEKSLTINNYTVNKKMPFLVVTASPGWIVNYPTETTVTAYELDEGDADLVYSFLRNGTIISSPDVNTFGLGNYVYTYNTSGGENYTPTLTQITLEVTDLISPIVTIDNPINGSYTGKNVWLNATTDEIATCSFGCQNGMSGWGGGPMNPPGTSHSTFLINLSYGLTTCSVTCNDVYNNTANSSVSWYVTKQYSFQLRPGWNFISVAYSQYNSSLPKVLESIDGKYDYVQYYMTNDTADHWKNYATFWSPSLNDLWELNNIMGFWIHVTEPNPVTFTVKGINPTSTSIELKEGWNMVGYPSFTARTVEDALQGLPWTAVEGFDPGNEYRLRNMDMTELMGPNNAYWINVNQDCIWSVNW